jgi:hypothetical protein
VEDVEEVVRLRQPGLKAPMHVARRQHVLALEAFLRLHREDVLALVHHRHRELARRAGVVRRLLQQRIDGAHHQPARRLLPSRCAAAGEGHARHPVRHVVDALVCALADLAVQVLAHLLYGAPLQPAAVGAQQHVAGRRAGPVAGRWPQQQLTRQPHCHEALAGATRRVHQPAGLALFVGVPGAA